MKIFCLALFAVISLKVSHSENILVICPFYGRSHFWVFEPLFKELAVRNHNVTVISHFPQRTPIPNFRDVNVANDSAFTSSQPRYSRDKTSRFLVWILMPLILDFSMKSCDSVLTHQNLRNFLNENNKFDVILYEPFVTNCFLGIAKKFEAPIIGKLLRNT